MLSQLRIGPRIFAVTGILALVSVLIAGIAISTIRTYNMKTDEMERLSRAAVVGERCT